MLSAFKFLARFQISGITVLLMLGLAACTPVTPDVTVNDPYEKRNRKTHEFNKSLDRALLKPASGAYGQIVPDFVARGVDNFTSNLSLPGMILNDLLQLNLPDAFNNTVRFTFNSTVGIGGLFDPASHNNIEEASTDFGETLYVWGVPEGRYVELPGFGPRTERSAVGTLVDFFIDPLNFVVPTPRRYIATGARVLETVGDRDQFSDTIESILYESEDSYAQTRLFYLQNRRRELVGELTESDLEDPYADF